MLKLYINVILNTNYLLQEFEPRSSSTDDLPSQSMYTIWLVCSTCSDSDLHSSSLALQQLWLVKCQQDNKRYKKRAKMLTR
jgi:hypothetical protein